MKISRNGDIRVLSCSEEDFGSPARLENEIQLLLEDPEGHRFVLDLTSVSSLSSLGVAVLASAGGIARVYEKRIAFAIPSEDICRSLELVGLGDTIVVRPTVEEAKEALGRGEQGNSRARADA